jgi:hypothetical protein
LLLHRKHDAYGLGRPCLEMGNGLVTAIRPHDDTTVALTQHLRYRTFGRRDDGTLCYDTF